METKRVNIQFVMRGTILGLVVATITAIMGLIVIISRTPVGKRPDPTPLPPTILAPRGELPTTAVGLQEWVRYKGKADALAGSGFLLRLNEHEIIGVTTAHSVAFDWSDHPVDRIALRIAGQADFVAEFEQLWGLPGRSRVVENIQAMSVDYVLLRSTQPIDPDLVLVPDPRGGPQPGERVSLFSGQGDRREGRRVLEGTVQSVGDTAIWVLMDDRFNPALMSGSPFVSQYTGRVVGMVVAATPRRSRLLLGAHPIGSIVRLAETATEFPLLRDYHP